MLSSYNFEASYLLQLNKACGVEVPFKFYIETLYKKNCIFNIASGIPSIMSVVLYVSRIYKKRGRVSNSAYSCANALRIIKFTLAGSNKL